MTITVDTRGSSSVALVQGPAGCFADVQAALDLMAAARHEYGCSRLLIPKTCFPEEFFLLKTGLAGEILQKYATYGVQVAIVGDFDAYHSKSLRDFIRESNRGGQIFFLPTQQAALDALHQ